MSWASHGRLSQHRQKNIHKRSRAGRFAARPTSFAENSFVRVLFATTVPISPLWGERMLASIQRGFGFLGQAIDLARKDSDLLKPSLYSLLVSAVVAIIAPVPMLS